MKCCFYKLLKLYLITPSVPKIRTLNHCTRFDKLDISKCHLSKVFFIIDYKIFYLDFLNKVLYIIKFKPIYSIYPSDIKNINNNV